MGRRHRFIACLLVLAAGLPGVGGCASGATGEPSFERPVGEYVTPGKGDGIDDVMDPDGGVGPDDLPALPNPQPPPVDPSASQNCNIASGFQVCSDVPFGPAAYARMDIFRDPSATNRPVIIFVHGGAWGGEIGMPASDLSGEMTGVMRQLYRGYTVISIHYRLSLTTDDPNTAAPGSIVDVKQAVKWVRARGAAWGMNPSKIVLWGHSAGGHLGAIAAATGEDWSPGAADLGAEFTDLAVHSARVSGAIGFGGIYDFNAVQPMEGGSNGWGPWASVFLHCRVPNTAVFMNACPQAQIDQFSPARRVTADDPPVAIITAGQRNGTQGDGIVAYQQRDAYWFFLQIAGRTDARECHDPNGNHGNFAGCNGAVDGFVDSMVR